METKSRLDQIRSQLEEEHAAALQDAQHKEAAFKEAQRAHKAISDALSALGKNASPSPKKRTVNKDAIRNAVHERLRGQPSPVPVDDLDAFLRNHFTRKGLGLTRFPLSLKEVLAEAEIETTEQGVRLVVKSVAA